MCGCVGLMAAFLKTLVCGVCVVDPWKPEARVGGSHQRNHGQVLGVGVRGDSQGLSEGPPECPHNQGSVSNIRQARGHEAAQNSITKKRLSAPLPILSLCAPAVEGQSPQLVNGSKEREQPTADPP